MFPKRREYVEVISRTDIEGALEPLAVTLPDGRRYDIDRILDHRARCYSVATGTHGERWRVRIGRKVTYVWRDPEASGGSGRWYVEVHQSYVPASPFIEDPASNRERGRVRPQRGNR